MFTTDSDRFFQPTHGQSDAGADCTGDCLSEAEYFPRSKQESIAFYQTFFSEESTQGPFNDKVVSGKQANVCIALLSGFSADADLSGLLFG